MPGSLFVSFEGCEGSGKSTQAKILHERLWEADYPAALVREPGTTSLGLYLRKYLKSERPLSKEAELLLFAAARAELVVTRIKPNLRDGFVVVADRFEASSIAYQGYGRNIDLNVIAKINEFATHGIEPDVTFFLDIDPAEGLKRVGDPQLPLALESTEGEGLGREDVQGHRRFEDEPLEFHERIRSGFLNLAKEKPLRWIVVNAASPVEQISKEIWRHVLKRLESSRRNWTKVQPLL